MSRLKELDVLRGFAALNVVLFHYTTKFRQNFGHDYPAKYDWDYGKYGVQLFFMISGFVIFLSLKRKMQVSTFARKRFMRLYPTYWICLCLTFVIVWMAADPKIETQSFQVFLFNLTMIQGMFNVESIDGAYWSLIPELLFYVFMAVLCQFRLLSRMRAVAVVWLGLMVLNILYPLPFGAYLMNLQYGMFFLAGILFYRIMIERGDWHEHLLIGVCLMAAVMQNPSVTWLYMFLFLLFYLLVYGKLSPFVRQPFLFLGYISYPLYLLHQYIGFVLMRKLNIPDEIVVILIAVICMVAMAWLVTRLVEKLKWV